MRGPTWPMLIAIAVGLLAVAVYSVMSRMGAMKPVEISQETFGTIHVLTKNHLGAYHKIVPVISEVETWAKANGEPCVQSFGEYFDDPEKNDEDRLKSRGGCLLTKSKVEAEKIWAGKIPTGMFLATIEARQSVKAVFSGAPSLGPIKVYPKVFEFMKQNDLKSAGAVIEIYQYDGENSQGTTTYIFPSQSIRSGTN
jgi:AraC family transcriptional regulator